MNSDLASAPGETNASEASLPAENAASGGAGVTDATGSDADAKAAEASAAGKVAWLLVGIDGTQRGETALAWALQQAELMDAGISMVSVIESESEAPRAQETLDELAKRCAASHPRLPVRSQTAVGNVVDELVRASQGHAMVVVGSHRKRTLSNTVTGACGLRVSVEIEIPTAVISCEWRADDPGRGIIVGVGPDDSSAGAIDFAARQALATGEKLELVSAWGLPAALSKPAEAMGGGISPIGENYARDLETHVARLEKLHPSLEIEGLSIEGSSPAKVLIDRAEGHRMLVLGTHGRTALGRLVFGSVGKAAMSKLTAPTLIVPSPSAKS